MSVLNTTEQSLLNAAPREFPMIAAASAALKRCGTCGHKNVNINAMLNTAVTKYMKDPGFRKYLLTFTKLPAIIGGILVE